MVSATEPGRLGAEYMFFELIDALLEIDEATA